MKNYFLYIRKQLAAYEDISFVVLFCMVFAGFFGSRIVLSAGVAGLFFYPLLLHTHRLAAAFSDRKTWLFLPYFLLHFFSYLNSEDKALWWLFLKFSLPFLILPFSFALWKKINLVAFHRILFCFVLFALVSSSAVMANYLFHYESITQSIRSGSAIPVPYSHIRYSLLLVFAFFSALWLLAECFEWVKHTRIFLIVAVVVLFVAIHLLSVRSGWMAFYTAVVFLGGYALYFFTNKKTAMLSLLAVGLSGFLFFRFSPIVQNKMAYMRYDIRHFSEGKIDDHSDGVRLASMVVGWHIVQENPLFGVGTGDILQVAKDKYSALFPTVELEKSKKMPHNQWLWIAASCGLVGLAVFIFTFLLPSVVFFSRTNWLWWVLQLIFFTSFMTEYTLEEQIGGTFYAVFSLLFVQYFRYDEK